MAKPLLSIPTLKSKDALRFLKEKERIESLKETDEEYKKREAFFAECFRVYEMVERNSRKHSKLV